MLYVGAGCTCATLLLNGNVHPKYVQELLGHASIAQTLDTYSHVTKGMDGGIGDVNGRSLGIAHEPRLGRVAAPLMHKAPENVQRFSYFPLFAGSLEVSRPGLEPGT
jgi:hypothetical protein